MVITTIFSLSLEICISLILILHLFFLINITAALEVTVRRLNDRVTAIRREQNYQRVFSFSPPHLHNHSPTATPQSMYIHFTSYNTKRAQARESVFHSTSESTNRRVTLWSIGQLSVLVVLGVWQMRHLKSFFKAKKLV
jgi:hypothetical protein